MKTNIIASILTAVAMVHGNAQPSSAKEPAQPPQVKNVVLVHGAFADGSGWRGVYDELTRKGYRVTIVQNPLTSLQDDVAATKRILARQDGPTILVGHSYGGTVITEAGVDEKVVDWFMSRLSHPTWGSRPVISSRKSPLHLNSSSSPEPMALVS